LVRHNLFANSRPWLFRVLAIPVGLANVIAVAANYSHSLALQADGTLVGWSDNSHGQITIPVGLAQVKAIAAGNDHNLVLAVGPPVHIFLPLTMCSFVA
jgi:hypothetical protein